MSKIIANTIRKNSTNYKKKIEQIDGQTDKTDGKL